MKKTLLGIFVLLLVSCLAPVLYAQAQEVDEGSPLEEITPVPDPTDKNTPEYTFKSPKPGTIYYEGQCLSESNDAIEGDNTIVFNKLDDGTYDNCKIRVQYEPTVTSPWLDIKPFTVDTPDNPIATSTFAIQWASTQRKYASSSERLIISADKLIGKINAISTSTLSQVTGLNLFIGEINTQKTSIDTFKTNLLAEAAPFTLERYNTRKTELGSSIRSFKNGLKNSNTKFSWLKTTNNLFKYADNKKIQVNTALSKAQIATSTRDSLIAAYDAEKVLINDYIGTIPPMSISTTTKAAFKDKVRTFKNNLKNINKRFSLERSTITKLDLKLNAPVVGTDPKKWGIRSMFNIISQDNYCTNSSVVAPLITTLITRLNERQTQLDEIRNLAKTYTFIDIRTKVGTMKTELGIDTNKLLELDDTCDHPTPTQN